jgi:8-oxo-dGTP pyrophosphatase MutT (NUDIX family)
MPISPYVRELRSRLGSARLLLPSVSAHVFDPDGRLLLVQQRDSGVWSTPGGSIEPDETPADAVVRETWEETGFLVTTRGVLGVFGGPQFVVQYPNGDEAQYVIVAFDCEVVSGTLRASTEETMAAKYWSEAEASHLPLAGWLQHILPSVYARTPFERPTWAPQASVRPSSTG